MKSNFHPRALHGVRRDSAGAQSGETGSALKRAINRTRNWLLDQQHADGHWVAELEGDTILESEYILLLAFLGQHTGDVARKAAQYILQKQMPEGGWTTHPGGVVDISVSVKAYFALKLTGHDPSSSAMQRARHAILSNGGADAVNSFTRFYLALLGQISYDQCPAVPPEAVLLPDWFPINLYRVSSWSRTIIVPLSIMSALQPVAKLDSRLGISELFLKPPAQWPPLRCPGKQAPKGLFNWDRFFRWLDKGIKFASRRRAWQPLRNKGLKAAERWVIERFVGSEGLGAIFPPMVWSIIALKCLGYHDESPELRYCHEHLKGLIIEQGDSIRLQPCKSPVWDTAITLRALSASGISPEHPALRRTVAWLLEKEVTRSGDWARTVDAAPGGWCFEYANEFYPDVDDSIMVVMALASQVDSQDGAAVHTWVDQSRAGGVSEARRQLLAVDRTAGAMDRAVAWVLAMQNQDGGWGAFDRDNDHEFLCHVPFADHNAMIDPSTPDLTGRVLEMLGQLGRKVGDPAVDRAIAYIRQTQEADGSWFGRWGVNYIYGTWQALVGLAAVGVAADDPAMVRGANWLLAYQQPSGGWGETPDSYSKPHLRGQGPTTASQTAWAVLGLIAAGRAHSVAVARGANYLVEHQMHDGTWHEPQFTGTGFPQVFYLRYHYYPIYFPLLALSQYAAACDDPAMDLARREAFSGIGSEMDS